ncbi:MAG TPA: TetR/AcrR family transcriptional regulator [Caulobacteraceae bacterium]
MDAAARQIRQGGLDCVNIGDLMKLAELTHGGFYGHFPSRGALIAAALDRALDQGAAVYAAAEPPKPGGAVKAIVNPYLNAAHRDDPGDGCAIGALSGEVGRAADPAVRARMAQGLEDSFETMAKALGDGPDAADTAVVAWCAMVGAINLARVFRGTPRSDQILQLVRRFILELDARTQDAAVCAAAGDLPIHGG